MAGWRSQGSRRAGQAANQSRAGQAGRWGRRAVPDPQLARCLALGYVRAACTSNPLASMQVGSPIPVSVAARRRASRRPLPPPAAVIVFRVPEGGLSSWLACSQNLEDINHPAH